LYYRLFGISRPPILAEDSALVHTNDPHLESYMGTSQRSKAPVDSRASRALASNSGASVSFRREDRLLVDELICLIGAALDNGDAAIIIAAPSHRDALIRGLRALDPGFPNTIAEDRFIALDAAESLSRFEWNHQPRRTGLMQLVDETIARARATSKAKQSAVVIFAEMIGLPESQTNQDEIEELWKGLAAKHSFTLRCSYPAGSLNQRDAADAAPKICNQHSSVVPAGRGGILLSDDEKLRTIAKLQQKLRVLESEKAKRAAEQPFRLLIEAVQDYAIFTLDAHGHINSWNVGAERLKGYRASEILGQHFSVFYPPEDIKNGKPQRELLAAANDGRVEDEGWRLRKDGSRFWANVIITATKDANGRVIGFSKVTRDFTERMQTQQALQDSKRKLQESEHSLRELSFHLLRTQDEERQRIGRDLHDSLGQYLSVLKMKLDCIISAPAQMSLAELSHCAQITEDALTEVRTISYLLYPPMLEEMGLKSAISWYLDGFTKRSGIEITFEVSPGLGRLAPDVELAAFRVLQESLTNVHRHSGSQTAVVRLLLNDDAFVLQVADQGKGARLGKFEDPGQDWIGALGVGLRGMRERMRQIEGNLELWSSDGGTTVTASVPLRKAALARAATP
jgi:PAS domain S-box-containing protein